MTTLRLRLLLLASLALAAGGCRPTFTCDPSSTAATTCHARWACTFTLCSPGQTCTMPFYIDSGVADVAGGGGGSVAFNFSSAAGSGLRGGSFGGDQKCGSAGCDDNLFSLSFQSQDHTSAFSTGQCEIVETPAKCAIEGDRKHPVPASGQPLPMVTAKLTCKNAIIPCAGFKASADVDFAAEVAWPLPPPPPPTPPSPISPPPAPVSPPPSPPIPPAAPPTPAAFAPGGAGTRTLLALLVASLVLVAVYAAMGYAYTWLLVRDRVPLPLDRLRQWTPWRCEEERVNGGGSGWRRECELLWCWCVPLYWRYSQRDAMDAYWAYHPTDDDIDTI